MKKTTVQPVKKKQFEKQKIQKIVKAPPNIQIWIVIAIFLLTTLVFFWGQLFGGSFFWEDFTEYVLPTQTFAAVESAQGHIPFWNPYTFVGMPFLADLQVGFFYPFNRILTFFVNSNGYLPVGAIQFIIILHFFIAQLSMYFLARGWKISSYGSVIAAISYSFSLIFVCHVIHPMIVYHLAWFPLVVMFFYKGLINRNIRSAIIAGLIFGMSMLSGHPQMTLYESLFLCFLFIWYFVAGLKSKELVGIKIFHFLICSAIPILIAVGIFSIQYLPSQELAKLSQRNETNFIKASEGSLEIKQFYTSIVPKIFGYVDGANDRTVQYHLPIKDLLTGAEKTAPYYHYWESAFYIGLIALLLGIFGALVFYKTRRGAFLIAGGLFGIIYALGPNGFIFQELVTILIGIFGVIAYYKTRRVSFFIIAVFFIVLCALDLIGIRFSIFSIFYNLPFFGNFRNPARMIFYFVFSISLLAGIGFDGLWESINKKTNFMKLLIISIIFLLIAFLIATGAILSILDTPSVYQSKIQGYGIIALLIMLAAVILSMLLERGIIKPAITGALFTLIIFIDLNIAGVSFNSSPKNPMDSYTIDPQLKTLLATNPPKDIFRVNMRMYRPSYQAMNRNQGMIDRIMLIEGYNPLILEKVMPPIDSRDKINELYNVKYQIDIDSSQRPTFVQRNTYFPRAWIVHNAVIITPDSIKLKMKTSDYNYKDIVVLEEAPEIELSKETSERAIDSVECKEYKSNYFQYKVKSSCDGILCFSEIWYPAWKAYIDGKPAKVMKANYCFRAVSMRAGVHIVEMKYESESFKAGMYISLITLFLSIIGMVFAGNKNQVTKPKVQ